MPSTSNIRAATHPTEPESAITQRSECDQEVDAYIRGQITVDEFLNTMDRHGSWIELFMSRLAFNPPPMERFFTKWFPRVS